MSQPVNLNRFRKAKARDEKRAKADENAVKFGRTKAQREVEETERDAARKTLDAHRREE